MSDRSNQQNRQGGQSGQEAGAGQKPGQQQQPKQKPGQGGQQGGGGQNNPNKAPDTDRGTAHVAKRMPTDQISFYDASLKKQIEGSFVSDGKSIHVSSVYGTKSAPYNDLGACIDHNAQVLLARKLLSELAAGGGRQKPDQQQGGHREPMQKGEVGGGFDQGGGGQGSVGTSP